MQSRSSGSERESISLRLSDELRASLGTAADRYHAALLEPGSPALSYLRGRGMDHEQVSAYRLGVVDGSIPEHAPYRGWLSIPYVTRLGGVVSLKFRRLSGDGPKYITPYPTRIYNTMALDLAERLGYVAICEGEFDAITLDGLCAIPAVAIPGVETWQAHPEWRELFAGFSKVLVFADQDEPGQKLAARILRELDTAQLVSLPAKDANESYLQYGADEIRKAASL
jgi:DNA primase